MVEHTTENRGVAGSSPALATEVEAPAARERGVALPHVVMIGAGQLARMTHQAAISLGVDFSVVARNASESAVLGGAPARIADPTNRRELESALAGASIVTFDHERIPPDTLRALAAAGLKFAPSVDAKLLAQDKAHARRELARLGFPVPPFTVAEQIDQVESFAAEHGWPLVAKPPRGGYDGRGVFELRRLAEARALLAEAGTLVLEPRLELIGELAVLVARSTTGEIVVYPVVETLQVDGMCREIVAPARVPPDEARLASELACSLAEAIDATGVLALELFRTERGLLVNELALRPHNSGHYSIEGCVTSQFEQHLRAILGWPLGSTTLTAPAVATVNVIGRSTELDPRASLGRALAVRAAHIHLYAKQPRPGRKLGHVTVCGDDLQSALAEAHRAARILEGQA